MKNDIYLFVLFLIKKLLLKQHMVGDYEQENGYWPRAQVRAERHSQNDLRPSKAVSNVPISWFYIYR
ncbi:hypothetical protein M513_07460 [Trichuris suis]|uniref:Uncharacterized protein n=1 Tax=Trichuris suis TaxID=68888 RepID=A0A085M2Y5_9BILA|nr:hypothetical protein M513_07460 [Trichuris suis]